jgi:hypothetical protein
VVRNGEQENIQTILLRESGVGSPFGRVESNIDRRCHGSVKKEYHPYTVQLIQQIPTIFDGVTQQGSSIERGGAMSACGKFSCQEWSFAIIR